MPELDLKNPEGDWERFEADVINKVHALGGQELIDALEYDNDIPVAVLHNGPADEGVNILTRPQQMQWALNGMILNSLPRSMEEGSPRKLMEDMPHAGGTVAGERQKWATLRARYSVEKPATRAKSRLQDLLEPKWPKVLSAELYQSMVADKVRVASELHMNVEGTTQPGRDKLDMWHDVVFTPPPGSPYFAPAEAARLLCANRRETATHRKEFVACMLKEIALEIERRKQRQVQQRARALSTVGVGCCPDHLQCADCDVDEEAEAEALAAGRGSAMGGAMGGGARRPTSTAPTRAPGGSWKRHPCVRALRVDHPPARFQVPGSGRVQRVRR